MPDHPSLHILEHSIVADALSALREETTSLVEFRLRARTIARALAYESTRGLPTASRQIQTPMCSTEARRLDAKVVAAPILRAGLGLLEGFLDIIPQAATGFIGLKRNEETLEPYEYYRNIPDCAGAHVFLLDPMLATGGSIRAALRELPIDRMQSITVLSIIAAPEGVRAVAGEFPSARIFTAALDERLDERGYIVPGLGDAGDRLCDTI